MADASKRVLMAMSGGIDSTVAAMLLLEQGYELIGVTYRTWDSVSKGCLEKEKGCCTIDSIMEAKRMCQQLGFEHHLLDLRDTFYETVIQDFISEYLRGRTPNPCVRCNATIKWGELLRMADAHNCHYIATGHYARIEQSPEGYYLLKGFDSAKDQTYFLWRLEQEVLARTLFPLGDFVKPQVREMARERGFEKLSNKVESQEICFIPDNDYRTFLASEVPDFDKFCKTGNFIDTSGNVLGQHQGYPNYTIGQRKGLRIALGEPMYVSKIDAATNTVTLGRREALERLELTADNCIFANNTFFGKPIEVQARIRYKSPAAEAVLTTDGKSANIKFKQSVWGITPGQSVVFYQGDRVIGGGIIQ